MFLFSTDPVKGAVWPTIDAIDHCFDISLPVHDVQDGDAPDIILNDVEHEGDEIGGGAENRRTTFTEEFRLKGVRRPAHALITCLITYISSYPDDEKMRRKKVGREMMSTARKMMKMKQISAGEL